MNKSLLMAITACAAMAMTSCSSEDLTGGATQANETPISFNTYLGRNVESRATGVTADNITEIGVFAAYTGNSDWANTNSLDFMMNQKVTKSGTTDPKWTYSPLKYWPANATDKISFFAYAPYPYDGDNDNMTLTAKSTTTAPTGAPVATFSIADADIAKTPDFVAACVMNKEKPADNTVKFTLKHAMTRVAMKAKVSEEVYASSGDANKTKVVITAVELAGEGLTANAKYTFPNSQDTNGKWEATGSTKNLGLASVLKADASGITGNTDKGAVLTDTDPVSILKDVDYLYLIPANNGTGLSVAGKVQAKITYSIVTEDAALANGSVTTTATKTVDLPADALAQGKSYTFTFTIGVNAIILDVNSVDGWGDEISKDLDV